MIEVKELVKIYKSNKKSEGLSGAIRSLVKPDSKYITAVDNVNFKINKGEIVGYLGPNGAGKSTTIKMLTGILHPTSGTVTIDGKSPQKQRKEVVANIGVVFGQRSQLHWDLRLGESFELLRRIYRIDNNVYKSNMNWLNKTLGIEKLIDTPVRQLSLGQRMRGELTASLIHSPSILFLDEPTIGLDIEAKHNIRDFILKLNKEKKATVILTTHDLGDVEKLCKRLIVINNGKIVEDGPLEKIVERLAPYRLLVIDCESEPKDFKHPKAELVKKEGCRIWLRFKRKGISAAALISELSMKIPIKDLRVQEPEIEDAIKQIYSKKTT